MASIFFERSVVSLAILFRFTAVLFTFDSYETLLLIPDLYWKTGISGFERFPETEVDILVVGGGMG